MSRKRGREPVAIDVTLVEIYEDLAHEDEEVRFKAAHALLTKQLPDADQNQIFTILMRLFRGLCSSRKAARLGFSIALTEALTLLGTKQFENGNTISPVTVVEILEKQTSAEGNTSGQDERDHYFGRLFGSEAIIKSNLLFSKQALEQWGWLLDDICGISKKKPWLRQECGWVLYNCVKTQLNSTAYQSYAVKILDKLNEHKLIRTPEGLAIWIEVRRLHPEAKLPKHIWKHNDPFSKKDLSTLADVLKDAKDNSKTDTEFEVQGSATWIANLHFVWDVVLAEIFIDIDDQDTKREELVQEFWQVTVDNALFAPTSSTERKLWGFLVMQRALQLAPARLARVVFSKNAVHCLMQHLKSTDRYLQRSAQKVIQIMRKCIEKYPDHADLYILSLLHASGFVDFDAVTKTKTIDGLLSACGTEGALGLAVGFSYDLSNPDPDDATETTRKHRLILNYESKLISTLVNQAVKEGADDKRTVIYTILHTWIELSFAKSSMEESLKKIVREKIQLALEQLLKMEKEGRALILDLVEEVHQCGPTESMAADDAISGIVKAGWKKFKQLHKQSKDKSNTTSEGLALLYGLVLFEIHSGDVEAIQILQELLEQEVESAAAGQLGKEAISDNADSLVEILLSFASRPSKFLRRITLVIFETFTSQITRDGLQSLTAILETKETKAGQQELFEPNGGTETVEDGEDDDDEDEDEEQDSDVEMLDSDVEVVSASESSSEDESEADSDEESTSDNTSPDSDDETSPKDAELLALETSLASALGTRKLTQADLETSSQSSSDSDMTDSEMLALDTKLAEVFRHRANASNSTKKKETKSAKENIINFKNRILDMLDVYIKNEYLNPRSLDLILPLLQLERSTNTKQLADRTTKLIQAYCRKCVGLDNVPILPPSTNGTTETPKSKSKSKKSKTPTTIPGPEPELDAPTSEHTPTTALLLLREIHSEASLPSVSNAHRASSSAASILLVKTLLKAGVGIDELVAVYAATRMRMLVDETCRVHEGFFVDWGNWCNSVRGRFGK